MKKLLLKSMLLLCALIAGSLDGWAVDVTSIINFGSASGSTMIEGKNGTSSPYTDSGNDSQGNTWTITTVTSNTKSFTQSATYSQVGAASKPVTSITFTTTLPQSRTIKAFSAKFGGFSSTAGDITLKVGDTTVGTGELDAGNDVTVSATNTTATGTVLTVTVTNIAKGVKCYYISYTYDDGTASSIVATPTISVGTGTYTTAQNVTLACDTEGATIHYTMTVDGTTPDDPSESDATYSTAISVTKSGTIIKAKAFKNGMTASSVVTATYTIKPDQPTITATGATVTITADEGCDIYYTTNNTAPTKGSAKYTNPFTLNADCVIKAIAYDQYDNASSVKTFNYTYLPLEPKNVNSNYYVKVTDVSALENGDAVLIVCENDNVAMSTEQKTNNRGEEAVTINSNIIDSPSSDVQKLVLMKIGNYFYFYTGTGFLYAASNSNNYLKTEATPDANNNAKAEITFTNGNAKILFQGDNSRKWLKHNSTNSLFSCYGTGDTNQDIVQIYKEVNRTITVSSAGLATFACNTALDFTNVENLEAYIAKEEAGAIKLHKVNKVPAATGVLLRAKNDATNFDVPVATTADDVTGNLFQRGTGAAVASQDGGYYNYVLGKHNGVVGFYKAGGMTVAKDKAYIQTTISSAHIFIDLEDMGVTGVNEITNTNLTNNTNDIFDLQGRKVAQPTKGLYIVNGKKVIVK
jgi:hypothetical protein